MLARVCICSLHVCVYMCMLVYVLHIRQTVLLMYAYVITIIMTIYMLLHLFIALMIIVQVWLWGTLIELINEETAHINENNSVQDEVDDTKSVTLLAEKSCVPDDIGTQGETKFDQTGFPSGSGANAPMAASPLSLIQSPLTKSHHHSASISIGKHVIHST